MQKNSKQRGPKRWDILADILPKDRPIIFVELGVWTGLTMERVLAKLPQLLYRGIDTWKPPRKDQTGFGTDLAGVMASEYTKAMKKCQRIASKYKGRALLVVMDTAEAANQFGNKTVDCVFIDADHSYEGCKRDILAWREKIRPGGIMAGHDYANDHGGNVKGAVDEIFGKVELFPDHVWVRRF